MASRAEVKEKERRMILRSLAWAAGGSIIDTETVRGGRASGEGHAFSLGTLSWRQRWDTQREVSLSVAGLQPHRRPLRSTRC